MRLAGKRGVYRQRRDPFSCQLLTWTPGLDPCCHRSRHPQDEDEPGVLMFLAGEQGHPHGTGVVGFLGPQEAAQAAGADAVTTRHRCHQVPGPAGWAVRPAESLPGRDRQGGFRCLLQVPLLCK